eukprot:5575696-Prymnesium_polylepis.2
MRGGTSPVRYVSGPLRHREPRLKPRFSWQQVHRVAHLHAGGGTVWRSRPGAPKQSCDRIRRTWFHTIASSGCVATHMMPLERITPPSRPCLSSLCSRAGWKGRRAKNEKRLITGATQSSSSSSPSSIGSMSRANGPT